MDKEEWPASLLGLLVLVPAGKATVTVEGHPLLSVDADEKTLDVEADGLAEAGLHLSAFGLGGNLVSELAGSMHYTGALSRAGWKLNLYSEGDRVLTMGKGVSRLTGRVSVNPIRLRRLLKVLKE